MAIVASKVDDSEREAVSIKQATDYAKKINASFY